MAWTASNYREQLGRELNKYVNSMGILMKAVKDIPENIPDWAIIYPTWIIEPGKIRIDIPYDTEKLSELRRALGPKWKFCSKRKTFDDNMAFEYEHIATGLRMEVILDAELDGSTCERIQVGEEIVPIYEVKCA